jgi:hypothetical protein
VLVSCDERHVTQHIFQVHPQRFDSIAHRVSGGNSW